MDRVGQIFRFLHRRGLLISLVVLTTCFAVVRPVMLSGINLVHILITAAPVGMMSLGMTLVVIAGEFDLSAGALAAFAAIMVAELVTMGHVPFPLALIFTMFVVILFEGLVGLLRVRLKVPVILTTLLAFFLFVLLDPLLSRGIPVIVLSSGNVSAGVASGVVMVAIFLLGSLLTRHTQYGRQLSLVGATRSKRINGDGMKIVVMVISGLLAVAAGMGAVFYEGTTMPNQAWNWSMSALAALSISGNGLRRGKGDVLNTLIGVLFLTVFQNGLTLLSADLSIYYQLCYLLIFIMSLLALFFFWLDRRARKAQSKSEAHLTT
ncbi:MAG: ABC transporter permease [Ktedonobacteraceae bacterium]|nr:ABC transporter permease [Ktedonobacteraceae bacterium]